VRPLTSAQDAEQRAPMRQRPPSCPDIRGLGCQLGCQQALLSQSARLRQFRSAQRLSSLGRTIPSQPSSRNCPS
jgi:hypothetical protein